MRMIRMAAFAAAFALAAPAVAHPRLVSSDPEQGASVARVAKVTLAFSEPLLAAMSGLDITMTSMPGMADHPPMKIPGVKVGVGPDGKSLVATLPRPLPAGSYEANWHAVSTDTHRMTGKLTFSAK